MSDNELLTVQKIREIFLKFNNTIYLCIPKEPIFIE
jgi:hypothetical protein